MIGKSVTGAVCCPVLLVVAGLPLGAQEPTWLGGHTDVVRCVAVLPDGRAISGGDDDVVKIWNIASEELLMTLEGHEDAVRSVAVTPDGRIVSATGAEARVWNSVSGACLRVIADDCAPVAVTGDGLLIAHARGNPHALRVRDLNTESAPRDLTWDTESGVGPIAVTRDGRVVSAHDNGEVRVWDPKTGTCERTLKWDVGTRPSTLATSPDWRLPAGAGADVRAACGDQDGRISVWDLQSGTLQKEWKTEMGPVSALAFLPDGRLVSAGSNLSLYVWDPATGKRLQTGTGHDGNVVGLALLADGRALSASEDCSIGLWAFKRQGPSPYQSAHSIPTPRHRCGASPIGASARACVQLPLPAPKPPFRQTHKSTYVP